MPQADIALLWLFGGLLAVCAEFCLPGWVLPGVAGAVSITYGVFRLWELGSNPAAFAVLTAILGLSAWAGFAHWPLWTVAALSAGAWAAALRLPAGPAAALAPLPALTLFALLRVAGRALANKTIAS